MLTAMFLAQSFTKTGLGTRLAYSFVAAFGGPPSGAGIQPGIQVVPLPQTFQLLHHDAHTAAQATRGDQNGRTRSPTAVASSLCSRDAGSRLLILVDACCLSII